MAPILPFRLPDMQKIYIQLLICLGAVGCAVVPGDRLSGTDPERWQKTISGRVL